MADSNSAVVAMGDLFAPCTRYRDLHADTHPLVNLEGFELSDIEELELTECGAEILLSGAFDLSDLKSFVQVPGRLVWLSSDAFLVEDIESISRRVSTSSSLRVGMMSQEETDGGGGGFGAFDRFTPFLMLLAPLGFQGSVTCDRFLSFFSLSPLETAGRWGVEMKGRGGARLDDPTPDVPPVSAHVLSQVVMQDSCTTVSLWFLTLDEDHCPALTVARGDRGGAVQLWYCTATEAGQRVLFEAMGDNQGPSSIVCCDVDPYLLFAALSGNHQLKRLWLSLTPVDMPEATRIATMRSLEGNLGLVNLVLSKRSLGDESWIAMCHSLESHPSLKYLSLIATLRGQEICYESKARRMQSIVDMLRANKVIESIELPAVLKEACPQVWEQEIQPRLKLNKYRPRIRAVKRTDGPMREPLIGRALHAVNGNASLMFMLLVGTADVDWVAQRRTRRSRKRVRYSK